jgi:uncharacterized protein (DUF697 family)
VSKRKSSKSAHGLHPLAILGLVRELRAAAQDDRPLVLGGAASLVGLLQRGLTPSETPGSDLGSIRTGSPEGAALYVYLLAGDPGAPEERDLRAASRAGVPIVAVVPEALRGRPIPYVLATDVVVVERGEAMPVERIARAIAGRLGESATPLAARLPVLRPAVSEQLIRSFSRKSAITGAAVFIPGADMPVLTLNQLRLVGRIASAYGFDPRSEGVGELASVVGAGFGFRTLARALLGAVPIAGWAIRAGVAYGGTRAVGEAATRWFEERDALAAPHEKTEV